MCEREKNFFSITFMIFQRYCLCGLMDMQLIVYYLQLSNHINKKIYQEDSKRLLSITSYLLIQLNGRDIVLILLFNSIDKTYLSIVLYYKLKLILFLVLCCVLIMITMI
jgi:hypothetical protein